MKSFRTHEANRRAAETLAKHVSNKRKTNPAYGYVHGISVAPREFHVYSKAGAK